MPKKDYAAEKEELSKFLSEEDLKIIQKNYLIKSARNLKIRELVQRGFAQKTIAALSGLKPCHVWHIANFTPSIKILSRTDLIRMQAALDTFSKEIRAILDHTL